MQAAVTIYQLTNQGSFTLFSQRWVSLYLAWFPATFRRQSWPAAGASPSINGAQMPPGTGAHHSTRESIYWQVLFFWWARVQAWWMLIRRVSMTAACTYRWYHPCCEPCCSVQSLEGRSVHTLQHITQACCNARSVSFLSPTITSRCWLGITVW